METLEVLGHSNIIKKREDAKNDNTIKSYTLTIPIESISLLDLIKMSNGKLCFNTATPKYDLTKNSGVTYQLYNINRVMRCVLNDLKINDLIN